MTHAIKGMAPCALAAAALCTFAQGSSPTDQLTRAIGLDEISVRQSDGEVRETVISLGKQLSRRWYVGYERGLNATTGNFQLIYRIAQRFTLRAQSGEDNSLDVIWTWRDRQPLSGSPSDGENTLAFTMALPGAAAGCATNLTLCTWDSVEKIEAINYKDVRLLAQFVAESGKIVPRRLTGVCTPHQRRLSSAIKQARNIALLPFAGRAS